MIQNKHKSFNSQAKFLYNLLATLSAQGYQPHLQQLLLLINYNEFYTKA